MKKIRDYQAAHLDEINAAIERDRTIGVKRNVSQTPSIYVTSQRKNRSSPRRRRGLQIIEKLSGLFAAAIKH